MDPKSLTLIFSARVPYDFAIYGSPGPVNRLVSGLDYYRSER